MGKRQKHKNHHIQESQEVSSFPAGDHKAAMNRQFGIYIRFLTIFFDIDTRTIHLLNQSIHYFTGE